MAITIVGTPQSGTNSNGGDVTLTFDGTPAQNDVVVVIGGNGDNDGAGAIGPSTAGYTQQALRYDANESFSYGVWTKVLGASPDATVVCQGSTDIAEATVYLSYVLRGVDTTTPMDATPTEFDDGTTTTPDPPSITTVTDLAWVIAIAAHGWQDAPTGYPSGYINTVGAGALDSRRMGIGAATKEVTPAGAENPGTFTLSGSRDAYSMTVAMRPSGGGGGGGLQSDLGNLSSSGLFSTQKQSFSAKTGGTPAYQGPAGRVIILRRRR